MHPQTLAARFYEVFGAHPTFLARAPGRVNLIGEHTDYNEGFVLPMAIDREVRLVGRPRADDWVRLYSLNFEAHAAFRLSALQRDNPPGWADYCKGVAWALQQAGYALHGFDAVVHGDVPIGSGLSSSAAIEMATIMAFQASNPEVCLSPETAARLAQRAENEFVGVRCGIMDQMIAALGQVGHALLIDCRTLEHTAVPLPKGVAVVVVDTGAPRALAASAYNERRAQCEAAAQMLGVPALRDLTPEEFEARRTSLPPLLARRAEHVVNENARVLAAVEAMRANDIRRLGALMSESHMSLRDLYEVSSPALDAVVEIALSTPRVYGARMTGAGFGGCAIALVDEAQVGVFIARIQYEYPRRTGLTPRLYVSAANEGARWQPFTPPSSIPTHRAILAHQPPAEPPLCAERGDSIFREIPDPETPHWWWCRDKRGRRGRVHERFFEEEDYRFVLREDFCAQELPLSVGEWVMLIEAYDGWALVENAHGERGWVPERALVSATPPR